MLGDRWRATRSYSRPSHIVLFFSSVFYVIFVDLCMSWISIPGICFQGAVLLFYRSKAVLRCGSLCRLILMSVFLLSVQIKLR